MKVIVNSLLVSAPALIGIVVSIATVPLYISTIGADRYGALLIGLVLLGYFGQADFGLGRALTQRISSQQTEERKQLASLVWSALAGGALVAAAGALLVYGAAIVFFGSSFEADAVLKAEGVRSAIMLALCVPVVIFTGVSAGSLTGLERFGIVSSATLVGNVLSQVLPLMVAAFYSVELIWLLAASLVGRVIGLAMTMHGMWEVFLRGMPLVVSWHQLRLLFTFGSWIMVTAIVGPLMMMSDRVVIGAAIGASAVVVYSVPFQIASRTVMFPNAVAQALFPRLASQNPDDAKALAKLSAVLVGQSYALPVTALICLAGPLMQLWLGEDTDQRSILIGQIVLIGFWFNAIAFMPYSNIQAAGNSRFTGLLHVVELPIYFALLFGLGAWLGLYGIALAFTLRNALDVVVLLLKARIWDRDLLVQLAGPLSIIFGALAISHQIEGWLSALIVTAASCGVLLLICWFQMPSPAKRQIMNYLAKRRPIPQ